MACKFLLSFSGLLSLSLYQLGLLLHHLPQLDNFYSGSQQRLTSLSARAFVSLSRILAPTLRGGISTSARCVCICIYTNEMHNVTYTLQQYSISHVLLTSTKIVRAKKKQILIYSAHNDTNNTILSHSLYNNLINTSLYISGNNFPVQHMYNKTIHNIHHSHTAHLTTQALIA